MLSIYQCISRTSQKLLPSAKNLVLSSLFRDPPSYCCTQKVNYVSVYMKWKKDASYDSLETIHRSLELKPVIALKNCIVQEPNGCIPISAVSKRGMELDVPMKVARFLRQYPSVFEEFVGPQYNLPWFRLTPKAIEIDKEEKAVYEDFRLDLRLRLKKLILMTGEKRLPLRIIQGIQWYLGLPHDFLKHPESNLDESFRFVDMEDGDRALAVDSGERMLSILQKNAMKRGVYSGTQMEPIPFPVFPSKGLRLKRKISDWLDEFQKLPYVSPYEDFSHLYPDSDLAEKRVVGVLHELLGLFVEHAAQRKKLLCLKKYLQLPQKFHKAFERHPHVFYLSLRKNTCTVVLKEAHRESSGIERHPLSVVRTKYIELLEESKMILKKRRMNNRCASRQDVDSDSDLESNSDSILNDHSNMQKCSL